MILEKKTLKKNPSNRKPIPYSTEFRLDINLNNFVRRGGEGREGELKCYIHTDKQTYIHTDRHTDPPTKRVQEEHSLLKKELVTWDI